MNKAEWKKQYRFARAMSGSIRVERITSAVLRTEVFSLYWNFFNNLIPKEIVLVLNSSLYVDKLNNHWPPNTRLHMKCNMRFLRASYPHRGRAK
jgi:hypothetical protein